MEKTLTKINANNPANKIRKYAGVHILADFWDCNIIDSITEIEDIIREATIRSNSTLLKVDSFKFDPQGVTSFAILAESHISIHTWPEKNYYAIDIFTCGDEAMPEKAIDYFKFVLNPGRVEIKKNKRGNFTRGTNVR